VSKNKNILILNTGGTFNKIYDEISGKLIVPRNNNAINEILKMSNFTSCEVQGLLHKDSLEFKKKDRKLLKKIISKSSFQKIIIVHGTDTMDKTAKYLSSFIKNKTIVLTGAMIPYSINCVEATSNFSLAIGNIISNEKNDIFIAMHGNVQKYNQIKKNREIGVFECQK